MVAEIKQSLGEELPRAWSGPDLKQEKVSARGALSSCKTKPPAL